VKFPKTVKHNHLEQILIQWIMIVILRRQSDLVNTTENVLPVCDKHNQNNGNIQKGEIGPLRV